MDIGQIKIIVEEAVKNAMQFDWWFYLLILIISTIGAFLGSYLKKKAENFATKEDIEEITKKIEDIRSQYNAQLESYKASLQLSNQLKLASLDKRLQKHQEAYSLWLALLWSLSHREQIGHAIEKCQNWWNENCLYLAEEARFSFKTALIETGDFINIPHMQSKERQQRFKTIEDAGKK